MKTQLKNAHGRLLSTKPELLQGWKQLFSSFESFKPHVDPFGMIYLTMIDCAIKGTPLDYESLLERCEKRVETIAKKNTDKAPRTEVKYREAQAAYSLVIIMGQLDLWMNEYVTGQLVKEGHRSRGD